MHDVTTRRNISSTCWIYYVCPSGKQPEENVRRWLNEPFICWIQTSLICDCQLNHLAGLLSAQRAARRPALQDGCATFRKLNLRDTSWIVRVIECTLVPRRLHANKMWRWISRLLHHIKLAPSNIYIYIFLPAERLMSQANKWLKF